MFKIRCAIFAILGTAYIPMMHMYGAQDGHPAPKKTPYTGVGSEDSAVVDPLPQRMPEPFPCGKDLLKLSKNIQKLVAEHIEPTSILQIILGYLSLAQPPSTAWYWEYSPQRICKLTGSGEDAAFVGTSIDDNGILTVVGVNSGKQFTISRRDGIRVKPLQPCARVLTPAMAYSAPQPLEEKHYVPDPPKNLVLQRLLPDWAILYDKLTDRRFMRSFECPRLIIKHHAKGEDYSRIEAIARDGSMVISHTLGYPPNMYDCRFMYEHGSVSQKITIPQKVPLSARRIVIEDDVKRRIAACHTYNNLYIYDLNARAWLPRIETSSDPIAFSAPGELLAFSTKPPRFRTINLEDAEKDEWGRQLTDMHYTRFLGTLYRHGHHEPHTIIQQVSQELQACAPHLIAPIRLPFNSQHMTHAVVGGAISKKGYWMTWTTSPYATDPDDDDDEAVCPFSEKCSTKTPIVYVARLALPGQPLPENPFVGLEEDSIVPTLRRGMSL